jgi:hypothetical protein
MWATPFARATLLVVPVVGALGCRVPDFQGPQIQHPPPAFTLNPSTYQDRRMFPDLEIVHHDAWVEASWGNFSGIYINGHRGALTREDVETARAEAIRAAVGRSAEFGAVEPITIDGREAWGWGESWRREDGGLDFVAFRAAVPYDTMTYAIDFLTGEPGLKIRPDSLRTVVASFAVGHTTWNLPLVAIGAGAMLLLINALRGRAQARREATRRMTLVRVPERPGDSPEGGLSDDSVAGQIARQVGARGAPSGSSS